jgi:peroxiredoxin
MLKSLALLAFIGTALCFAQRGQQDPRATQGQGVKVGQKAPTFKLDLLEEGKSFDLAQHTGKQPVVLVFGSYT